MDMKKVLVLICLMVAGHFIFAQQRMPGNYEVNTAINMDSIKWPGDHLLFVFNGDTLQVRIF